MTAAPPGPTPTITDACPRGADRRTARESDRFEPAYEWVDRPEGRVLVLRSFSLARAVLRLPEHTRQWGFQAEQLYLAEWLRWPVLYQEGAEHRRQRKLLARYFTPKAVQQRYRPLVTSLAEELVGNAARHDAVYLDRLAFRMAMRVVAEVVGLTAGDVGAMERRLDLFFASGPAQTSWLRRRARLLGSYATMGRFYVADVRPAVAARRRAPADDLISHLIAAGVPERDILIEAVTYAAAGMVTTRQFITVAAWQLLERPSLRAEFLAADQGRRHDILAEVVRLDSIAGELRRQATTTFTLTDGPVAIAVPRGSIIEIPVRSVNADVTAFGQDSLALNPGRHLPPGVPAAGLSFGDGHHSCPGEFLAMHEADVFLTTLLRREVTLLRAPEVGYEDDVVRAVDLRDMVIRVR